MSRRLHNSLVALSASAAVLVGLLLASAPVVGNTAGPALAAQDAQPRVVGAGHRHRSHALRLPFFSFAIRN